MTDNNDGNNNRKSLDDWLQAMTEALGDLAESGLGFEAPQMGDNGGELKGANQGAYVALIGEDNMQMGILSDAEGCKAMARALLAMEPDEEIGDADVADAMGEVMNIVGGGVKTRMAQYDPSLKLGLPLFIDGRILASGQFEEAGVGVSLGPINAQLIVLRHRSAAKAA